MALIKILMFIASSLALVSSQMDDDAAAAAAAAAAVPSEYEYEKWLQLGEQNHRHLHDQAKADYQTVIDLMNEALQQCRGSAEIIEYTHRLKELHSMNQKIKARIAGVQKDNKPFVYYQNMNDIIGFRILTVHHGQAESLMACLKEQPQLKITNTRTRDGMVYYASGQLRNTIGLDQNKALYEIQIWPFAMGKWMIWQHGIYYKAPEEQKAGLKTYVKAVQDVSSCLGHQDFFQVLQSLQGQSVREWARTKCLHFLKDHRIKQSSATTGEILSLDPPIQLKPQEYDTVIEDTLQMAKNIS